MIAPFRLSAKESAQLIERGELEPQDLVRSCLERIAAREADVRAWAFLEENHALEQAAAARGPLRGVPVGVKDIFDTFDMPTEYGSRIYAGHRPRSDSAAVALTRHAGGVILGKTITAEFATFVPGKTRNPHNLAHTPGGSSSGSAAAVADLMVPLAFGTQTAGSVIRPGSYCGVIAYKPTYNMLPRAGVKANAESLDTVGVYGRSVEDVSFFASALTSRRDLHASIDSPRIAFCRTFEWDEVEPAMARAFEAAARRLNAGELRLPPAFRDLRQAHTTILRFEGARCLADEFRRFPELLDPGLRKRCAAGFAISWREYAAAAQLAAASRARLEQEVFADLDVLIAPAATGEAPAGLGSTGNVAMNVVWTLLHVPCISIPMGQGPNGLPLALQVIGRIGDDARVLASAAWIHRQLKQPTEVQA